MGHNESCVCGRFCLWKEQEKERSKNPILFLAYLEIHLVDDFIVEPLCLLLAFKEDAHPRMRGIGCKVVQHKPVALHSDLLDLTVRNRAIPMQDELATQVNAIVKLIKILHHIT